MLKDAVVQTSVCSPNPFLPGHIAGLHFPASLAIRYDLALEFQGMECGWKWCMPFQGFAHETLLHNFFVLFPVHVIECRGGWSLSRCWTQQSINVGPSMTVWSRISPSSDIPWYGWEVNVYCVKLLKSHVRINTKKYMLLSPLGTLESSCVLWRKWDLANTGHCLYQR